MVIKYSYKSTVFTLNENALEYLKNFKQTSKETPESGGLLLGRTNIYGNTTIFELTRPMEDDIKCRCAFKRKDKRHIEAVKQANQKCLYYKGNWHTHPQEYPSPSWTDKLSWKNATNKSKPGDSEYIFFIIVGTKSIRVWCGNMNTKTISEMTLRGEE